MLMPHELIFVATVVVVVCMGRSFHTMLSGFGLALVAWVSPGRLPGRAPAAGRYHLRRRTGSQGASPQVVAGTPRVEAHLFAFGLACLGALAWAITNIYMKQMGEVRILPLLAWTGLLSLPQVALIMWLFEGNPLDYVPTAPWTAWSAARGLSQMEAL